MHCRIDIPMALTDELLAKVHRVIEDVGPSFDLQFLDEPDFREIRDRGSGAGLARYLSQCARTQLSSGGIGGC
jgi:hypothetical protein